MKQSDQREVRDLLLTLWDKAVSTDNYDKREWLLLEYLLDLNSPFPETDRED